MHSSSQSRVAGGYCVRLPGALEPWLSRISLRAKSDSGAAIGALVTTLLTTCTPSDTSDHSISPDANDALEPNGHIAHPSDPLDRLVRLPVRTSDAAVVDAARLEGIEPALDRLLSEPAVAAQLDVRDPAGTRLRPDPILGHPKALRDLVSSQQRGHSGQTAATRVRARKLLRSRPSLPRMPRRRAPRPAVSGRSAGTASSSARPRGPSTPAPGGCPPSRSAACRTYGADRETAAAGAPRAPAQRGSALTARSRRGSRRRFR